VSFDQRSYSGKVFRPTPEAVIQEDGSFGVIATPWGPRDGAKKAADLLTDYVLSARQDLEATSPFQKLTCLSPLANSLRAGVMMANDTLYREENKAEYTTGCELLVFAHAEGELAFAQVGYPHLFLARKDLPWIPLSVQMDLATELSEPPEILPPLPQNLIGLHTSTNMNLQSLRVQSGDRLIFLSHSVVSHPMFSLASDKSDLDTITQALSKSHPDLPFWLGVLSF
jgi:hypothetical protein